MDLMRTTEIRELKDKQIRPLSTILYVDNVGVKIRNLKFK